MSESYADMKDWIDEIHTIVGVTAIEKNNPLNYNEAKRFANILEDQHIEFPKGTLRSARLIIQNAETRRDIINCLQKIIFRTVNNARFEHLETIKKTAQLEGPKGEAFRLGLHSFEERLKKIRPNNAAGYLSIQDDIERRICMLDATIGFGISNTATTIYSYLDVIPDVFYATHNRGPSPSENMEIANESILPLMHQLSRCQEFILQLIDQVMRRPDKKPTTGEPNKEKTDETKDLFWSPFHAKDFELQGKRLSLTKNFMDYVKVSIKKRFDAGKIPPLGARRGCPWQDVFPIIYELCLKLAKRSYFLYPEHIRSLPREIDNVPRMILE